MKAQGQGNNRGRLVFLVLPRPRPRPAAPDTPLIRAVGPLPGPFPWDWGLPCSTLLQDELYWANVPRRLVGK